jgi:hypothetical protein
MVLIPSFSAYSSTIPCFCTNIRLKNSTYLVQILLSQSMISVFPLFVRLSFTLFLDEFWTGNWWYTVLYFEFLGGMQLVVYFMSLPKIWAMRLDSDIIIFGCASICLINSVIIFWKLIVHPCHQALLSYFINVLIGFTVFCNLFLKS